MQKHFLIIGMPPGGLFVSKQLRKMWPDCIIYAVGNSKDIGKHSNTINCFYEVNDLAMLSQTIMRAFEEMKAEVVEAYICSNPMLENIISLCPEVFDYLKFENALCVYQRLVDKNSVEKLCCDLKVNRPQEYSLCSLDKSAIVYPVVVKPLEKRLTLGADKCAFISNESELDIYLNKIESLGVDRSLLLCQQCIPGDNRWEYGYGGYFKNGEKIIDVCFYQFRQVPQGLCCYCREISDLSLIQQIKCFVDPVLKDTKYNGLIEFDIKQDPLTKDLFLLDINPRPWRSVDMLASKLGDSTIFNPTISAENIVWRYPLRELLSWKNEKNVKYSICKNLAGGRKSTTQLLLYDKKDKAPYFAQLKVDFSSAFAKAISRGKCLFKNKSK